MTDSPEIPDSVSPEMLDGLLRNRNPLPTSDTIPSLDLGGETGAPCDLQFAMSQLISRSSRGTNIIQMLVASLYLAAEVEDHFSQQLQRLMQEDPPYADASAAEQQLIGSFLSNHLLSLRMGIQQLESLLAEVGYPYYQERARQLLTTTFKDKAVKLRDFRSHMMISDELLGSLQVDRAAVTDYLDNITKSTQ